ncbi:hypothetical protein [Robertkochia aurantiaca]|uniref:hypothetical protein n=1 Tax=Robertkochia aurantiaca TaxID=2873700 RepID=UPI001CCA5EC2|nr:hypothetical protein [Robertkochia sp. 3YJGBD-33]
MSSNHRDFSHLEYLLSIKNEVGKKHWPEFADKNFHQPIVYYTRSGTFVLNPNEHIRSITQHSELPPFQEEVARIRLSASYTDTTSFQFASSYSDEDRTQLHYRENVLLFQSFDLTQKFIPDITDIQDWSIMVIHELFHGYQRAIPEHKAYYVNLEIPGGPDEFLGAYHRDLEWFKESVRLENELLKGIWRENRNLKEGLKKYDSIRAARIDRIKKEYGIDIRKIEDYEILTEGHARYFESLCKRYLSEQQTDTSILADTDNGLITGMFQDYEVAEDKNLYNIYNDRYYYPLGYNIAMILEKHLPEYAETIYRETQSFDSYLDSLRHDAP